MFGGGLRRQNVGVFFVVFFFFSFLLFALDLSTLICASLLSCCQQKKKYAEGKRLSSSTELPEWQEEHFKEL